MSPPPPLPEILLIASPDGPITAYDPYTGTVIARFNGSRCPRNGITIIGSNQFAVSHVSPETGAGSVHLYNWWSPFFAQIIPLPEPVATRCYRRRNVSIFRRNFRPDQLVIGSDDGTIAVVPIFILLDSSFETESRFFNFKKFAGHESSVTGLTTGIGSSGSIMISSSLDWTCKVWSLMNGIHLQTVKFPGAIWCTALDPSETEWYAAGTDGIIYNKELKVETKKQVVEGGETVAWGGVHSGVVVAMEILN